jgi:predicted transcriptional regulator YdeE
MEGKMNTSLIQKGPIRLVGMLITGKPEEIVLQMNAIWMEQFMPHAEQIRPFSVDNAFYGAWIFIDENTTAYLAGMAVEDLPVVPAGLVEKELPAAQYAVFDCTVQTIGQTLDWAYHQWLPGSPFEYDISASDFEYYPPSRQTGDELAQIYIPVRQKQFPPPSINVN